MASLGIRGANPIWSEFNLAGKLFDDTYYLWVLENQIPYIPATVYHDPDLNVPWASPLQFLGNGTLPNDVYFVPDVVYRLEFRQHVGLGMPTQADPLIYLVENYVPGSGGSTPVDTIAFPSNNQISNPQFALIDFTSPLTISSTNPAAIPLGPDWYLDLAGTGTAVITQVPLNDTIPTTSNAPYALRLQLTGWTTGSVFLRQRFYQNGTLWSNKFVSSTLTAALGNDSVSVGPIVANIVPSTGTPTTVLNIPRLDTTLTEYTDHGDLPASTNTDIPPAAYIDYLLSIPSNIDIYITSIQLVISDLEIEPSYIQDSINRQIDYTFHYYKPQLEYKPIPSYLVGWDFILNPYQALGTTPSAVTNGIANNSYYIADQTILFQSVDASFSMALGQFGMNINAAKTSSFAIVQYIPYILAQELLTERMSVAIGAASNQSSLNATVNLYWTASALPSLLTPTFASLVSSMAAGPVPTIAAGWTVVPRTAGSAKFTLTNGSNIQPFMFSGFDATAVTTTSATFMAIVISFDALTAGRQMTLEYCSLNAGDIATRPAAQTPDQVLRQCQFYYETSYDFGIIPGTVTSIGSNLSNMTTSQGTFGAAYATAFQVNYKSIKRADVGALTFYSPTTGTAGKIFAEVIYNGRVLSGSGDATLSSFFTAFNQGEKSIVYAGTTNTAIIPYSAAGIGVNGFITYHWVADARLGII